MAELAAHGNTEEIHRFRTCFDNERHNYNNRWVEDAVGVILGDLQSSQMVQSTVASVPGVLNPEAQEEGDSASRRRNGRSGSASASHVVVHLHLTSV